MQLNDQWRTSISSLAGTPPEESIPFSISKRGTLGWNISWLPALTLFISDVLAWPAIFIIFCELRTLLVGGPGEIVWQMLIIPSVICAITLHVLGGYDRRTDMYSLAYMVEHLLGQGFSLMTSALLVYGIFTFGPTVQPSRLLFACAYAVFAIYSLAVRRWMAGVLNNHHSTKHFVMVADSQAGERFSRLYRSHRMRQELRVFSSIEEALPHLDENADGFIVGFNPSSLDTRAAQLLAYVHFRHIPVFTMESFHESNWRQVPVQSIEGWWAFAQDSALVRDSFYDHIKRLFDLVVATVVLFVLLPFLLMIAIVIRLESRGPALFRQTRIGRDGRPFTLYKFRSMRQGSESGSIYTAPQDPRVTRFGQFLRKTRLDELPQLWNVVLGDMSIIGPRAEWIKCVEQYDETIPFYGYRHLVRPGITGWAQVNYSYGASNGDAEEKLKYDLFYIRHYSMALDFAIILKTLHTVLFAKGR
jgi:exopolysaccharide biosynthesis polyprenyl glycosylphosphotransferase